MGGSNGIVFIQRSLTPQNQILFPWFISDLYLNLQHSCSPNLFVQNVFVDTHDLRFPWVAFFASK